MCVICHLLYTPWSSKGCFTPLLLTHQNTETEKILPVTEDGLIINAHSLNLWSSAFHSMKAQILNHSGLVFIICTGLNPPHSPGRFRFITSQLHQRRSLWIWPPPLCFLYPLNLLAKWPDLRPSHCHSMQYFLFTSSTFEVFQKVLPFWHFFLDETRPWQPQADDLSAAPSQLPTPL